MSLVSPNKRKRITPLDAVILTALAGLLGYIVFKAATGLNYHWKWDVIPQYLLRFDEDTETWKIGLLTQGLVTTLRLSIWSGIIATILGTIMGLFRTSPSLFKRQVSTTYVGLIRNTPPRSDLYFLFLHW